MAEMTPAAPAEAKPYLTIDPVDATHGILILSNMDVYQQLAVVQCAVQMLAQRILASSVKRSVVKPNGIARRLFGR